MLIDEVNEVTMLVDVLERMQQSRLPAGKQRKDQDQAAEARRHAIT
jgi:hypothetical protein